MPRKSRYRASEIKAGIWIFIALIIFAAFIIAVTGSKFWEKLDYYRVRLNYVGGLEVGSPVRMGGVLVGKVGKLEFLLDEENFIELTLEVNKGLRIKETTTAYLSSISITSEQHLELEQSPEPAPLLSPGDLIPSKELTTMDEVMEHVGVVGDTLQMILSRVNQLLKPENVARIDSIISGVAAVIQEGSEDFTTLLASANRTVGTLDTLLHSIDGMVAGKDSLIEYVLLDTRETMAQAIITMAEIDSTVEDVDQLLQNNAGSLMQILDNLNHVSENLKELSSTVKDNPFLLIRAIPREERRMEGR